MANTTGPSDSETYSLDSTDNDEPDGELGTEQIDEIGRLIQAGLPRATVAARFGLTRVEFNDMLASGRQPDAPMWLRVLEHRVRTGEVACQEAWLLDIRTSRSWQGTFQLLKARFKGSWGDDAPTEDPIVPEQSGADWDAALDEQLKDENSELCEFLRRRGFVKQG